MIRRFIELLLWPIDAMPPFLGLTIVSIVTGVVLLWLVGKTTHQSLVGRARDRMTSAIYEIRLYLDSPLRVFASQGRLLKWSFVYIASMIPALLAAALPLGLLYFHLEVRYGLSPLEVGREFTAKIQLAEGVDGSAVTAEPSPGVELSPASLFDHTTRELFLKGKVVGKDNGALNIRVNDESLKKELLVEGVSKMAAPDRFAGMDLLWQLGAEAPLPTGGAVESLSISHEALERTWLGMPWWMYWLLVATVAALALRKKLDISI